MFSGLLVTFWNAYDIGTVAASIADIDFVQKRKGIEQALEDGTISFLSISSLRYGFKIIDMLTISAIARYISEIAFGPDILSMIYFSMELFSCRHTASLATYVRNKMLELKHSNEKNVCIIYGQAKVLLPRHFMPSVFLCFLRPLGNYHNQ